MITASTMKDIGVSALVVGSAAATGSLVGLVFGQGYEETIDDGFGGRSTRTNKPDHGLDEHERLGVAATGILASVACGTLGYRLLTSLSPTAAIVGGALGGAALVGSATYAINYT